ncbi:hypothetical protein [Morganella morganii]|uniref:hypothetical protein n=1 Tax=Morganella morganii TaxID=582 RepID=UPI00142CFA6D|nr:hypothetical protein [Morganella morganii]EBX6937507.1 hypothetical protein [Salmonella enterica subsp. enterica serovar Bareilly]MDW7785015.1 hypothetical protein [Morganella morganii]HDT3627293.1 hypothetical protein [Morganella morganii subsp. morganii]HEI8453597.1 hypothetical protein [Morganella morganii]
MPIYIAIASNNPDSFANAVSGKIEKNEYYRVDNNTWLINAPHNIVTPKELCDHLGVTGGALGRVMVMIAGSYWGFHQNEMWGWLESKRK